MVRLEMGTLSTLDFPDKGEAYKHSPCVVLREDLAHITHGQWCIRRTEFWAEPASLTPLKLWPTVITALQQCRGGNFVHEQLVCLLLLYAFSATRT